MNAYPQGKSRKTLKSGNLRKRGTVQRKLK